MLTSGTLAAALLTVTCRAQNATRIEMSTTADDGGALLGLALRLVLILFLIGLSGIFCGLTIGVMGLDTLSLEIIASAGREPDRSYAQTLLPVRRLGHQALATLVLGNMATNVVISELIAAVTPDSENAALISFIVASLVILIFAEVIPQSICKSSKALFIAAQGVPVLNMFLLLMYPVAKPLGALLDLITPHDVGQIYNRSELKKLMKMHCETHGERSGLDDTELQLMLGAMEFHESLTKHIMTPMSQVTMISADALVDRALVAHLWSEGLSRIPVYSGGDRHHVIGVLHTKNLISLFDKPAFSMASGDASPDASADSRGAQVTVRDALTWLERATVFVSEECRVAALLKIFEQARTQIAIVCEARCFEDEDSISDMAPLLSASMVGLPHGTRGRILATSYAGEAAHQSPLAGQPNGSHRVIAGIVTMEDVIQKLLRSSVRDEYDSSSSDSGSDLESSGSERDDGRTTDDADDEDDEFVRSQPGMEPNAEGPPAVLSAPGMKQAPKAAHRKLHLEKPPRRMPAVNFYSFVPHELFSDSQKWVVAEYLREMVVCFSSWKVAHVKLLLDLVGDRRFVPPPPPRRGKALALGAAASPLTPALGAAVSSFIHHDRRFFEPIAFHAADAAHVREAHRRYVGELPQRYVLCRPGQALDFMALVLCGGVDIIAEDVPVCNELRSMSIIGEQVLNRLVFSHHGPSPQRPAAVGSPSGSPVGPMPAAAPYIPDYSAVVVRPSRLVAIRQRDVLKVESYIAGLRHHDHHAAPHARRDSPLPLSTQKSRRLSEMLSERHNTEPSEGREAMRTEERRALDADQSSLKEAHPSAA
jgi:CBS domain containing-hemolysin-like protein